MITLAIQVQLGDLILVCAKFTIVLAIYPHVVLTLVADLQILRHSRPALADNRFSIRPLRCSNLLRDHDNFSRSTPRAPHNGQPKLGDGFPGPHTGFKCYHYRYVRSGKSQIVCSPRLCITVAIVHRLWDVMQLQRSVTIASSECCNRCHKVHDASRVVIESGSLYTAAVIATFIASILRCSVVHLFSAIVRFRLFFLRRSLLMMCCILQVVHIVGISYNLIIANSLAPPSLCADPHHPLTHTPANLEFAHHPRERAESPIRFSVGPARFRVEDDPAAFMPPTRSKFRIAQLPPLVEEVETKGV